MKRTLQLLGLVITVLLVCSRPAEAKAGWWDWLEDLSGPGPFTTRGNLMTTIICSDSDADTKVGSLFKLSDPTKPGTGSCLYFDYRAFRAEADQRYNKVDVSIAEFGPSVRLHPAVEVGAGVGFIHFSSTAPGAKAVTATRFTISFPRLVFMPLQAIPSPRFQNDNRWGFLKLYWRETIITGELDQSNFATIPGAAVSFRSKGERVKSMGFIIDLTAFLPQ